MEMFKGGWIANLSNGETVYEAEPTPGDYLPWRKLLIRLKEENLKVTALRIRRGGITINALPQKQCDGYYHAYEAWRMMFSGAEGMRQGVGSVVGDKVYIVWLAPTGEINPEIRMLESERVHTTL